jgi:beta-glucosidase
VDVQNVGQRAGKSVVQLYIAPPKCEVERPGRELKAFAKVELAPGQTKSVTLLLNPRSFSYYDTKGHTWLAVRGNYGIRVGQSVEDTAVQGKIHLSSDIRNP